MSSLYGGKKKKKRAFDRTTTTNPERRRRKKKNTIERKREKGENRKQTFYLRDSFPFFSLSLLDEDSSHWLLLPSSLSSKDLFVFELSLSTIHVNHPFNFLNNDQIVVETTATHQPKYLLTLCVLFFFFHVQREKETKKKNKNQTKKKSEQE
jgi:hypothetical protein